jgi:hypothetical protein
VGPNGTYTYDVIAEPAGALAYHCHVPPVMQHVRMGLYGAFIVYPKTPLPPAREYVFVNGEYDTQNQLNPLPEYYFFNGYTEQYQLHPLPAMTNETVRIYLINLGLSPAYGIHIHGSLFKVYPSGILENPTFKVQSWELASGNTAILEAKWPWPGKFTFHYHGIPEERGAMGYFNVTNAPANAIDGKDIAITKSINMNDWQMNLTKSLQKADPNGKVTTAVAAATSTNEEHHGMRMSSGAMQKEMEQQEQYTSKLSTADNAIHVSIVKGATTLDNKAFSPDHIKVKVGDIDVSYKIFGKGQPLLLIPGFSQTMDMWDPIVLNNLSSNHTVIIFDNRGIGNTSAGIKSPSIQQFANDTAGLIDVLGIKKPVDILGLSMGGFIAQELTLLHPEKVNRLIIHASSCGGKESLPPQVSPDVMTSMVW